MRAPQSILVSIDRNSTARPTLAKALALARRLDASLELFLCDAEHAYALKREYDPRGVDQALAAVLEEALCYLDGLRASVDTDGVRITTHAACESPLYEGIIHEVQRSRPDMVVRCISGDGAERPTTPGATDWALARACPVPLLLVRDRPWKSPPPIGAAVDVSSAEAPELTVSILEMAALLSAAWNGTLEVLYSDESLREPGSEAAIQACKAALGDRIREARVKPDHIHVLTGDAARTLPELAAGRGYDLLVLGALSHRRQLTELIGTLTIRLIERLDCDFLLVKPATYVSPVQAPC